MIILLDGIPSLGKKAYGYNKQYQRLIFQTLANHKIDKIISYLGQGPSLWSAEYAIKENIPLELCLPCKNYPVKGSRKELNIASIAKKRAQKIIYADREFSQSLISKKGYIASLDKYEFWKKPLVIEGIKKLVASEDLVYYSFFLEKDKATFGYSLYLREVIQQSRFILKIIDDIVYSTSLGDSS